MEVRKRLRQTAGGKKEYSYFVDYRDPATGERKRTTLKGVKDKAVADKAAAKFYSELIERHHLGKSSGPTVKEKSICLGKFLDEDLNRVMAPSTRALESWRHKPLKRLIGESTPVVSLTFGMLKRYQLDRSTEDVANSTVNDELAILRAAMNRAVKDGTLFRLPCEMPDFLPEEEPERRFLTEKQVEKFFTALWKLYPETAERAEVMYRLGGLRPKELWSLTWRNVDFDHGRVAVQCTKRGNATKIRYRIIPMSKRLKEILQARQLAVGDKSLDPAALVYGIRPEERKGHAPKNTKKRGCKDGVEFFGEYKFGERFKKAAALAKLPFPETVTPYVLRHTAATNSEGADITDVSYMLGHSDIRTTANIYRHLKNERLLQGIESLSGHILGTNETQAKRKPKQVKAKNK